MKTEAKKYMLNTFAYQQHQARAAQPAKLTRIFFSMLPTRQYTFSIGQFDCMYAERQIFG